MTPEKALNIIAGQCSKKEMCSNDVRKKLIRWEIQPHDSEKIITFLISNKFIDDRRFAGIYAEDKFRFNHWGKQKISMMLHQKGLPSEIIEEALQSISEDSCIKNCLELLEQKMRSLSEPDIYKLRIKLTRFAAGRGFDFDTIRICLEQLLTKQ